MNSIPTIIFIFGGSGDLAYRKLVPALYNLYIDKYLPDNFYIYGIGRSEYNEDEYINYLKKGLTLSAGARKKLKKCGRCFLPI